MYCWYTRIVSWTDQVLVVAATSGRVHPGHHDGSFSRDGFRGPSAQSAAPEETQLQPAGRGQRARSDDRQ